MVRIILENTQNDQVREYFGNMLADNKISENDKKVLNRSFAVFNVLDEAGLKVKAKINTNGTARFECPIGSTGSVSTEVNSVNDDLRFVSNGTYVIGSEVVELFQKLMQLELK